MKTEFGTLKNGQMAYLYEISCGQLKARISDYGATLVQLYVPDSRGNVADVLLGFDSAASYDHHGAFFGATVGRNANRVGKGRFPIGDKIVQMPINNNSNNLHSGPESYGHRLWTVEEHTQNVIRFSLESPDGDQGMPGNAKVFVTFTLEECGQLRIAYDATADQDTVFNMTNHAYFNMAGHDHPEKAMSQTLMMPARFYTVADAESIPTGELRPVDGTPMDFRTPKAIGRDLGEDYPCFKLQGGYDHNFDAEANPCAVLSDPESGRTMEISTDCPGIQFYSGNFLCGEKGKNGAIYTYRGGVALETQFYPDSMNHPDWPQPVYKAGEKYHSETTYKFTW